MTLVLDGSTGVSKVQDGVVTAADLSDNSVTSAKMFDGFANGISMAQQWQLNSNTSISNSGYTLISGWVENAFSTYSGIGTGMTHSSGTFTFPETGVYLVDLNVNYFDNGSSKFVGAFIFVSTDSGSNYNIATFSYGHINYVSANTHECFSAKTIVNVTNTSTHKLQFKTESAEPTTLYGSGGYPLTSATFIRLGDAQ